MNDFLLVLLSLSLSGAFLTLLLLALTPLVKKRLPKSWFYYVWGLVALRMLFPVTPEHNLMNLVFHQPPALWSETSAAAETSYPRGGTAEEKYDASQSPDGNADTSSAAILTGGTEAANRNGVAAEGTQMQAPGRSREACQDIRNTESDLLHTSIPPDIPTVLSKLSPLLFASWLSIFFLLFSRKIFLSIRCARRIRRQALPVQEPAVLSLYHDCCRSLAIRRAPQLYCANNTASPMLVGLRRTFIVFPAIQLQNTENLAFIFRHELIHYKRQDVLYNWLFQFVSCLHFFNPAVYIILRQVSHACELSCDESVIRGLDSSEIMAYGNTLLDTAALRQPPFPSSASISLCENAKFIKERLTEMKKNNKKTKLTTALTFLLSVLFCFSAFYTGSYAAPSQSARQASSANPSGTVEPAVPANLAKTAGLLPTSQPSAAPPQTGQPDAPEGYTILKDETLSLDTVSSMELLLSYEKVKLYPSASQTVRMIVYGKNSFSYKKNEIASLQMKEKTLSVESGDYNGRWSKMDTSKWQPQIYLFVPAAFSGSLHMEIGSGSLLSTTPLAADSAAFITNSGSMKLMDISTVKTCELTSGSGKTITGNISGNTCTLENSSGALSTGSIQAQQSCNVSNGSGKLNTKDISGSNCTLSNISGQFRQTGLITANRLDFINYSGHSYAGGITAERFSLETSTGYLDIESLSGHGSAASASGDITVDLLHLNGSMDITVNSGGFYATLDKNAALQLDGFIDTGYIDAFFPVTETNADGHVTGLAGKAPYHQISASVSSGYIQLDKR